MVFSHLQQTDFIRKNGFGAKFKCIYIYRKQEKIKDFFELKEYEK